MSAIHRAQFLQRQMQLASAQHQATLEESRHTREESRWRRHRAHGEEPSLRETVPGGGADFAFQRRENSFEALYELFAALAVQDCLESALNEVLLASIELVGADGGFIRLFDVDSDEPGISGFVAHIGIPQDYLDYHANLKVPTDPRAREEWLKGERVIVEDIASYPPFQPHRPELLISAGYRTMQGSPLMSRNGSSCVGMVATCFRRHYTPPPEKFDLLDLYAEIAANVIERHRQVEQLARRDSVREKLLRQIHEQMTEIEERGIQEQKVQILAGLIAGEIRNAETELRESASRQAGTAPGPHNRNPYGLSDREMEVLLHVWRGLSDKQIARLLLISRFTIAKHVGAILRKMNVQTRAQAGVLAEREGLFINPDFACDLTEVPGASSTDDAFARPEQ
jgi:DNA-binding CsgD family transcriptional regulator